MRTKTIRTWKVLLCVLCMIAALLPVIGGCVDHDLTREMMLPDEQSRYSEWHSDEYETFEDYLNSDSSDVAVFDSRNIMTLVAYISVAICVVIVVFLKNPVLSAIVSIIAAVASLFTPYIRFILPAFRWFDSFDWVTEGTSCLLCGIYVLNTVFQIVRMRMDSAPARKAKREAYYRGHPLSAKSKMAAVLLAIFCGGTGAHRYYLGYIKQAVMQSVGFICMIVGSSLLICFYNESGIMVIAAILLLLGGGTGIWAFVDFIRILTGGLLPADGSSYKDNTMNPLASSANDTANALEKLAKLHGQGILTDEEFQQKKADLLAKM